MASLYDTFRDYEIDLLEMISEQWGIYDEINWRKEPAKQISNLLDNSALFNEIISTLPPSTKKAFQNLLENGGRVARDLYARSSGDVREMGAAIREKNRPDRSPENDAEFLFYYGLIALAFFENNGETREYYFIPDEFLHFSEAVKRSTEKPDLNPVAEQNLKEITNQPALSMLHMLALQLAILRGKIPQIESEKIISSRPAPFINALLHENQIIENNDPVSTEKLKYILLAEANTLLAELFNTWYKSDRINDLRLVPGLVFEGQWINDPIKPRKAIIDILKQLPSGLYFSIDELVNWIFKTFPDFMRSGGEYDQWFIKESGNDQYLKGFSSWPKVEGAYIRYLITGPLMWFGALSVGHFNDPQDRSVFLKAKLGDLFINQIPIPIQPKKSSKAIVHKNGEIYLPHNVNRETLYHFARFCVWAGKNEKYFKFRLIPDAIRRAGQQKINNAQVKSIIKKFSQEPIPSSVFEALNRWEISGPEILVEAHVIVRFNDADTLQKLTASTIGKIVKEKLNDRTIIISNKDVYKLENILGETGYLVENRTKYNQ